ncbi:MAG: PIN domain-containing protein [Deltaproteobacteria bacterium]|nr:PIN domain-containing protein [Deltaproteobacteria bacterium]
MPGDKIFLDTNILIYAYDVTAGDKHKIANNILVTLWKSGTGVLSTQVLQEFFVNIIQKIPKPIEKALAKNIVRDFLNWDLVVNYGDSILNAIDISSKYGYSFWDSLIIEAAGRSGAKTLLTEDLADNQIVNHITIKNPFK